MSTYFDKTGLPVSDGNDALASDLNNVIDETDQAFEQVEQDINSISNKAFEYAENDPFVPVDVGTYSAKHYAELAKQWAIGTPVDNTGTPTGDLSSKTHAENAATSASNASTSASSAAASASAASTSASNAATSESNAATSESNASTSASNALTSENKAQKWAEEAEDVEVDPGEYSAYHWAQKAQDFATAAVQSVTGTSPITVDNTDTKNPIVGIDSTKYVAKDSDTGAASLPVGTVAQRPGTPASGMIRFNDDDDTFEGYNGTEWGAIGGGGGLDWTTPVTDTDFTAEDGFGYKIDTRTGIVTVDTPSSPTEGMRFAIKDDYNVFSMFNCLVDPGTDKIEGGVNVLVLDQRGQYVELTYGAANGWVITATSPIADVVYNKPFMHVVDQKGNGVNGGDSVAGYQTRDLNTIRHNDIDGASLNNNQVTLPAGEYWIEAESTNYQTRSSQLFVKNGAGSHILVGIPTVAGAASTSSAKNTVSGRILLTAQDTIELNHYLRDAETSGLGFNAVSSTDVNVYSELRIWRIDRDIKTVVYDDSAMTAMPMEMIVQRTEGPSGDDGVTLAIGDNQLELNSILVNDIPGASRTGNDINLPAGYYEIEGIAECFETNLTQVYIKNDVGTVIGVGHVNRAAGSSDCTQAYVKTRINLASADTIEFWVYSSSGGLNGRTGSGGEDLVWNTFTIRKLDSVISTPVVDDSTLVAARPLFHVRDQKADGVTGGSSIAGTQVRDLNTVMVNEISGASLGTNQFTLPPGTYLIKAVAPTNSANRNQIGVREVGTTPLVVAGMNYHDGALAALEGRLTITESKTYEILHYTQTATADNGLGVASNFSAAELPNEIYTEVWVWKLDELRQTPVVAETNYQAITNEPTTGGIIGGELVYLNATQFQVNPVSCMDDTLTTALAIDSTTNVTISGITLNEVYNAFLVKTNTGTFGIEVDTDVDGANLPANVVAKRWIGFVLTDSSSNIEPFVMLGDKYVFATKDIVIQGSTIPTTYTQISLSAFVPVSRIRDAYVAPNELTENVSMIVSVDGVNPIGAAFESLTDVGSIPHIFQHNWYLRASATTSDGGEIYLQRVTLKR